MVKKNHVAICAGIAFVILLVDCVVSFQRYLNDKSTVNTTRMSVSIIEALFALITLGMVLALKCNSL